MDPNPLQYQQVDENEPLYRAAMLSAVAVGVFIVLVLGINYVVRHAHSAPAPSVKRDYETSPDDTVNGMQHAMSEETSSASASGASLGPLPSQSLGSTTAQQSSAGGRAGQPYAVAGNGIYNSGAGFPSSEPPSVHHTHGSAMRDLASINPENLADLLSGR